METLLKRVCHDLITSKANIQTLSIERDTESITLENSEPFVVLFAKTKAEDVSFPNTKKSPFAPPTAFDFLELYINASGLGERNCAKFGGNDPMILKTIYRKWTWEG